MKKSIRIISLIGAILLIVLVLASLVFACLDVTWAGAAAMSCIFAALFLSILLFGVITLSRHLQNNSDSPEE